MYICIAVLYSQIIIKYASIVGIDKEIYGFPKMHQTYRPLQKLAVTLVGTVRYHI